MNESTVCLIQNSFVREAKCKKVQGIEEVMTLQKKKHGTPLSFRSALDEKVQLYLLKVREPGGHGSKNYR